MNDCEHAKQLGAYRDGELEAVAAGELETHLVTCPQCAAELQRLVEMSGLLKGLADKQIPQLTLARLHQRVDLLATAGIRKFAEVMAAAAAVILVTCSIGLATLSRAENSSSQLPDMDQAIALGSPDSNAGSDEAFAAWMVQGLEGKE